MEVNKIFKIILDLCGGTGAWSKPYKDAGYNVRNITLPEFDVRTFEPPENVYGILAAPPCTEFSRAKGSRQRNFVEGIEIVKTCLSIIWKCRIKNKLAFWALENPFGLLRQFLGKPVYSFQPWWFGDFYTKKTDLWGYFNVPKRLFYDAPLLPKENSAHGSSKQMSTPIKPLEYKHLKLTRSDLRAITPQGFARAFFEANQ